MIMQNDYAKFWELKEVYYGICASRELTTERYTCSGELALR